MSNIANILYQIGKVRDGVKEKLRLLDELEGSVIVEGIAAGRIGMGPVFRHGAVTRSGTCVICRVPFEPDAWVKRLTVGRWVHEKCGDAAEKGTEDVPY
jgi:hypothetical protein